MGKFAKIFIVVPTFNEAENIPQLTAALFSLPMEGLQLLIVDDNSPDGTGDIADAQTRKYPSRIHVIHRTAKIGFGSACIEGFEEAIKLGADALVQMDADFSHPPEKILELVDNLKDHDIALGSRYIPGGQLDTQWPLWRKGLSSFGNLYAKSILGLTVKDATGGFRAWTRDTMLGMPLSRIRSNGYAFQVEMIYVAQRLGFSVTEVPFYFADRHWGESKMSFKIQIEAAVRVWQMLLEYRDLRSIKNSNHKSLII